MAFAARVVLILSLLGPSVAPSLNAEEPWVEGGRLTFELTDLEGRPVRHDDPWFQGKVVLFDIFGSWCPPCLTMIPTFRELHERHAAQGLVVVGVAFERDEDAAARRAHLVRFVEQHRIEYLVLDGGSTFELERALPGLRGVRGFPIEVLVGRDGRVVETRNGYKYTKRWARKLEARVAQVLD